METLFRTVVIEILQQGRDFALNSTYSHDKWEFIGQEQRKGVSDDTFLREDIKKRGPLANWINRFLAKDRLRIYTLNGE